MMSQTLPVRINYPRSLGAAKWPSPRNLSGAQTERPSNCIGNHHLEKKQGERSTLKIEMIHLP